PLSGFPKVTKQVTADICWMDTRPLDTAQTYLFQMNSSLTRVKIQEVLYKININTLENVPSTDGFGLNDVGKVRLKFPEEFPYDPYQENKLTGGAILIDGRTNLTVGALMLN